MSNELRLPGFRRLLLSLLVVGAGSTALLISQYYSAQSSWVEEEQGRALKAIADNKTNAISAWRRERLGDAQGIPANPPFARFVRDYIAGRAGPLAETEILNYFDLMKRNHDYTAILLFETGGKLRIGSNELTAADEANASKLAQKAMAQGSVVFEDFDLDQNGVAYLAVGSPVVGEDGRPVGAIVLRIDPSRFLYKQIQSWPTPSTSGETLLVRREGDSVLYLNELRHRKGAAMKLRLPLGASRLPAARAARGFEGFLEGEDYRGVPVLAAVREIPEAAWFLVAKIDLDEAYSGVRTRTLYFGITVVLLAVLAGCATFLLWSRRESHHYRELYASEAERRALASRYEYLQRYANDVILLVEESGTISEGNERALTMYGYSREELLKLNIRDLRAPSAMASLDDQWRAAYSEAGTVFETLHRRKDGSVFPVEVSSRAIQVGEHSYRQSFIRDISERKRTEQALRNSQADLNRAQAVAQIGSWRLDLEHNQLQWSDETFRMFGIAPDTPLTYQGFLSMVHPDDREAVHAAWQEALKGGGYDIEHRIYVNGSMKWVRECAELDIDAEGKLQSGFGTVQDITARKASEQALRESEQRFRQLVENIDSVFWIADPDTHRLLYISPAIERMWGISPESLNWDTRKFAGLVHPEDLPKTTDKWEKRKHQRCEWEYRIVLPSGQIRWVRDRTFPIADENGVTKRVAGIAEDITERKRTEQAMQRMNESLQEFAFAASHDLQEPIRVVQCFTQLLERRFKGQLGPQGEQLVTTIIDGSRRMGELVQGLLAYTRLTQQERLDSPVDMEAALGTALAMLRGTVEEAGAEVTHDTLPTIQWESAPAVQLFQNLIGNAVKYRKLDQPLRVHVQCESLDGMWHFSVSDNGIGMEPALKDRIFGLFKRLHGREYPGTGIGLAICRKLVERQGGRIWAESEPGKGSVFHFVLPVKVHSGADNTHELAKAATFPYDGMPL